MSIIRQRLGYIDLFRGLLIAHMALDHSSLMFNVARPAEELARGAAPVSADLGQFLTRFTGVPVAPGFFFVAGLMVALSIAAHRRRSVPEADTNRYLLTRAAVLIAADALVMGLPRALMGFYSFMVLSSVGVGVALLALLRRLPSSVLFAAACAVMLLHPLLDVSSLGTALRAVLYEPVRDGAFRSLYPIIPWFAIMLLGFVVGRAFDLRGWPAQRWLKLASASLVLFLLTRLTGGYGNAYAYQEIMSEEFWTFAKYPPDLPFLTWSFAVNFAMLAALQLSTSTPYAKFLRPLAVFGRVPFFFYIVHFYLLGIAAALVRARYDLWVTYAVWILVLLVMAPLCRWYFDMKRERPSVLTRYV
jgi:uncharacterized membrane protein